MKQKNKQKNKWLDLLIIFLFIAGIIGVCVSLAAGAFKMHPIIGWLVVSAEAIIIAGMLYDIKDK